MMREPMEASSVRERTLWGYWAQGYDSMPEFFKMCVETWKRHNPDWDVRILDLGSVYDFLTYDELPNVFMDMPSKQTASDCVRLGVLARYGGIYMDVSILVRCDLDRLCWSDIRSGRKTAAVFYHPDFGTDAFDNKDFVESWFLATKPGNPFFIQWRDLFCELFHDRLKVKGLLEHPLYQEIDLSGIDRLNEKFGANFDFREYLAIHAMCHRILETDEDKRLQWQDTFIQINARATAFKAQLHIEELGEEAVSFAFLRPDDPVPDGFMDDVPLIKFTTPQSGLVTHIPRDQYADEMRFSPMDMPTFLGRLLADGPEYSRAMSFLDEMWASSATPNALRYNTAIAACEKVGQWEQALSLVEQMRAAEMEPSRLSLNAAISTCQRAGQLNEALQLCGLSFGEQEEDSEFPFGHPNADEHISAEEDSEESAEEHSEDRTAAERGLERFLDEHYYNE